MTSFFHRNSLDRSEARARAELRQWFHFSRHKIKRQRKFYDPEKLQLKQLLKKSISSQTWWRCCCCCCSHPKRKFDPCRGTNSMRRHGIEPYPIKTSLQYSVLINTIDKRPCCPSTKPNKLILSTQSFCPVFAYVVYFSANCTARKESILSFSHEFLKMLLFEAPD